MYRYGLSSLRNPRGNFDHHLWGHGNIRGVLSLPGYLVDRLSSHQQFPGRIGQVFLGILSLLTSFLGVCLDAFLLGSTIQPQLSFRRSLLNFGLGFVQLFLDSLLLFSDGLHAFLNSAHTRLYGVHQIHEVETRKEPLEVLREILRGCVPRLELPSLFFVLTETQNPAIQNLQSVLFHLCLQVRGSLKEILDMESVAALPVDE